MAKRKISLGFTEPIDGHAITENKSTTTRLAELPDKYPKVVISVRGDTEITLRCSDIDRMTKVIHGTRKLTFHVTTDKDIDLDETVAALRGDLIGILSKN